MSYARRALQSLTLYRPDKTYNGFTLFTPMAGNPSNTWLIDMHGRLMHRWKLAGWVRMQAVLLTTGNLLYAIWKPEGQFAEEPFAGGEIIEVDWDGNIVWRYAEQFLAYHDWIRLKNGNTMIQKAVPVPKDIAAKVKGGIPGSERDGVMRGNCLQEITPDKKVAWEWLSYEHLDPELDAFAPLSPRYFWPLFNSLLELPEGNILTCSPYTDNLTIIDKTSGDVIWRWGKGIISFAHNPTVLDNGNILLFENGRYGPIPTHSRVIEVNPSTMEIEWEYKADNPVDFYSNFIGGCERLPNGNTLICEGSMGRIFEVTPRGELVWEYIVPFYSRYAISGWQGVDIGLSNLTFRAHRYGPEYPGLQGKKLNPEKLDLWNRLYGPEAFAPWGGPSRGGMERAPITEEGEPVETMKPEAKEEPKPSMAEPGERAPSAAKKEEKMRSRLERLGY